MDKLNSITQKLLTFFDKNATLVIVLALAFIVYKKFGSLLGLGADAAQEQQQAEAALATHDERLVLQTKPLPTDPVKMPAVARENVKILDLKLQAQVAEKLYKATQFGFSLPSTRRATALEAANQMKKYNVSFAGVVGQYKAVSGGSLQTDMRVLFGDEYPRWLSIAGTVK